jgi:hypothetical protein
LLTNFLPLVNNLLELENKTLVKRICKLFTGGTLGLCTGMSLLSMVEIAFWLMKIPSAFFKAMTKKPQKKPKDGINKSVYF